MDSQLISFIISILSGAIGGNAAPAFKKELSLGAIGSTLAGVLGGGLGTELLPTIFQALDITGTANHILSGIVGGLFVSAVAGYIKHQLNKKEVPEKTDQPALPQM
jgi:uncharacterized membrane protein YeaQ/YmgE (transglycosylase-associated protein family)